MSMRKCVSSDGSIYFSNTRTGTGQVQVGFHPVVSWFGAYNYFVRCNKEGLVFHDTYSGISVYNPYTGEDNHLSIREGGDVGNNGKYYGVYSTGGYMSTPYTYYFQEAHPNQENKNILSDCANISVIKASPNGNIYFQENTFESIYEYNPATGAIRQALQLESSGGISLVGCGFKNTLYLMDVKNRMFKVYNMDTGEVRDVIEYSDIIRDFRVSPNGNIYFRIVSDIYQYNYSSG